MLVTYHGLAQELSSFLEQHMALGLRCAISLSIHLSLKRQHPYRYMMQFMIYYKSFAL